MYVVSSHPPLLVAVQSFVDGLLGGRARRRADVSVSRHGLRPSLCSPQRESGDWSCRPTPTCTPGAGQLVVVLLSCQPQNSAQHRLAAFEGPRTNPSTNSAVGVSSPAVDFQNASESSASPSGNIAEYT